jgi:hypothetical protein
MSNYRMWAYSMIAIGLINWDYQRSHPNIALHSLAIVLPGAILLGLTYVKRAVNFLNSRAGKVTWLIIGAAALIYGFLN